MYLLHEEVIPQKDVTIGRTLSKNVLENDYFTFGKCVKIISHTKNDANFSGHHL